MNKLSELSKPAAYKFDHGVMGPGDFKYGTPQMHSAAKDENASPLYSQEYVSALLAELEAKDKHIADMEHVVAAAKCDDEIWDAMAHRLKTLEAKLATPVRLPRPVCTYADHSYPAYSRKQVEEIITTAGMIFTVEGDE